MTKEKVITKILKDRIFAVLRLQRTERIVELVTAIIAGGIGIVEVTLNSGDALQSIRVLQKEFPNVIIGAGTVIGYDNAVQAIEHGAQFLVSPVTDLDMLSVGKEVGVVTMAGALTPTEAWQASEAGADFVKLFPMAGIGPEYLRAMRGPLNEIQFITTNGVTLDNIGEYFAAGAVAVGIGTPLVSDRDMESENFDSVRTRAEQLVKKVHSLN
ncbi:MAG: bifunctional 4-hydroxy-2-oxoglutarate aldolase/2-dehydro-3-deoxy-phosphogluconate aldolase [Candidatus Kapaibacterium sp.]|jgi:2-dehydro-3-deoxyphosphogluconate aldolase/(4S)-4-hydroxy-2-oxoglutarate aldolase